MEQMGDNANSKKLLYLIVGFSLVEFLLHLYTNAFAGYGYFRDELYYIACSKRLAWGYVDQPPLSIFILAISRLILGDSVFALRFVPALASGFTVFFAGEIARELSGKTVAITAACLSLTLSPIFLGMFAIFSMNSFDWLLWAVAFYIVVRLIKTKNEKSWIWLGIVVGLGLLNKIDFLWLGAGLVVSMMFTEQRKYFMTKWPYVSGAIALLIFSPFIVWNITHGFAHLEFIRNATFGKYSGITRWDFLSGQLLINGPVTLPVWLSGLYFLLFHREGKRFRLAGLIFVTTFLILLINGHSKSEYLSATMPLLFAAGGVMVEKLSNMPMTGWIRIAAPIYLFIGGIFTVPYAIPILPVDVYIRYSQTIGIQQPSPEGKHLEELPQFYADMFGWENMAATVSKVYTSLTPEEQKRAKVFTWNYGEAGSIDFFAEKYRLPPVICPHNNFWYWGYGDTTRDIMIAIGGSKDEYLRTFSNVEEEGNIESKFAIPYENNLRIFVCRGLKTPIREVWNRIRFFI
ncbi:MAG TPA: glycosyltransferase family 39 protein [Candidatus Acidoferrales bacterium]|nr:glycosyltransferase family 39 protein [Candidatus Acidoferrales bacterium]